MLSGEIALRNNHYYYYYYAVTLTYQYVINSDLWLSMCQYVINSD